MFWKGWDRSSTWRLLSFHIWTLLSGKWIVWKFGSIANPSTYLLSNLSFNFPFQSLCSELMTEYFVRVILTKLVSILSILTNTALTISPGLASFGGCLIQSPKFLPHFAVSKRTGVTNVRRFFFLRSRGVGPGSTSFFWDHIKTSVIRWCVYKLNSFKENF